MKVEDPEWGRIVAEGALAFGLAPGPEELARFRRHAALLLEWARAMNLSAVTDPEEIARRHFVDSLALVPLLPAGAKSLVDLGSGAGFPGIPVKVARPDLTVTLVDSARKKVSFQMAVIRELAMTGIEAVEARAEDLARAGRRFDAAVARAVAALPLLWRMAEPILAPGGSLVALKGRNAPEEARELAAKDTGLSVEIHPYTVPGTGVPRHVVRVKRPERTAVEGEGDPF